MLIVALGSVVVLARRASQSDAPPEPDAFVAPPGRAIAAFDVERSAAGQLALRGANGAREVNLPAGAKIEVIEPATLETLQPGQVLSIIGAPNQVKNFAVRMVLVMEPGTPLDAEGLARSPSGFAGDEASRDAAERPMVSGTIELIAGNLVAVRTPAGPVEVEINPAAPLRRLRGGTLMDISSGDRIALKTTNGEPDFGGAVLVLVGGAR